MKAIPILLLPLWAALLQAQQPSPTIGTASFNTRCAVCHGGDGKGTERAPGLLSFVASHQDGEIAALIRSGVRAMPAHTIPDPEMTGLLGYLHTLQPVVDSAASAVAVRSVQLADGRRLQGQVLNETRFEVEMASPDGRIHILRRRADKLIEPSRQPEQDWPRYDGSFTSNRYSSLNQITRANVSRLALQWIFPILGAPRLEATPIVADGIMYVTAVNAVYALDPVSGRRLWTYRRPATPGLLGEAAGGANRGVAVARDRVFMMTDNAHLLAIKNDSGHLLWDVATTDWPQSQYSATAAPLVIGEHVVTGVAGGEEGARGFVASYNIETGQREWQFWTVPVPGEKLAETWKGGALEHGCGATWMSGSYDPQLDLAYWAVGNPCPDYNGVDRLGDNLYTDSVLALKPDTGELSWHFQFTPHDTHDWDAAEPLLLVDAVFEGRPRKLLLQANRNGFFFVLDRADGTLLRATPFVTVNWASGYTPEGRPILLPDTEPTAVGTRICPGQATNWMSASYAPSVRLMFVSSFDRCRIDRLIPAPFEMGKRYFNGAGSAADEGEHAIRALDLDTGKTVWNYVEVGAGRSASGTLSTGGLVFLGEDSGVFTALDAKSGQPLWHFNVNEGFRASPMTYMIGGRQYICIASGAGFLAFALPN